MSNHPASIRKRTSICSIARQAQERPSTVYEDNLTTCRLGAGHCLSRLSILRPYFEESLSRVRCCEIVDLHTAFEIRRAYIGQKPALGRTATGGAIQDIGGLVLGSEYRIDLFVRQLHRIASIKVMTNLRSVAKI
jgi:hypothetical protein